MTGLIFFLLKITFMIDNTVKITSMAPAAPKQWPI
jgi:hypothetical protein